jgi:uncharacterized DUF497 family protein
MKFQWDRVKASINQTKHGVSFNDAMSVFADPLSFTYPDPKHSSDEERFLIIGLSGAGQVLVVSHVFRADCVRIISARKATRKERAFYESEASH